jgi:hypothetical protein
LEGLKNVARDARELNESRDGVELDVLDGFVELDEEEGGFLGKPGEVCIVLELLGG